jgi:phosphoglucomutase
MDDHWATYGRDAYSRHDYEGVDKPAAQTLMSNLRMALPTLPGREVAGLRISAADEFAYEDPVDGSRAEGQGIRLFFGDQARAVLRLSGTGTVGATLRVYLGQYCADGALTDAEATAAVAQVASAVAQLTDLHRRLRRTKPDVET